MTGLILHVMPQSFYSAVDAADFVSSYHDNLFHLTPHTNHLITSSHHVSLGGDFSSASLLYINSQYAVEAWYFTFMQVS